MPRDEFISFKNDKITRFAAQLMLQAVSKVEDDATFKNLILYQNTIKSRLSEYNSDTNSWQYMLISQLEREVDSLYTTLLQSALNRDPIQRRQGLIDITESIKVIQQLQENLKKKNLHIFPMADRVNGPWGNPEYIDAYVIDMKRCQKGTDFLATAVFDENSPEVIYDYDQFTKLDHFNKFNYKKNNGKNRTYMMNNEEFEAYKGTRPHFEARVNQVNIINLNGSIQARDDANAAYTVDFRTISNQQEIAKNKIVNSLLNSFSQDNGKGDAFVKDLNAFIQDLKKLHYDMQNNQGQLDDKMRHVDSLLSLKHVKKEGDNKYKLEMNLENPEEPRFLDNLISFVDRVEDYNSLNINDEQRKQREFNRIFTGDTDSFRAILMDLKDFEKDPMIPDAFKAKCKKIQNKFEAIVKNAVNELQVGEFEKYVIGNTGVFNFGRGEAAVDGVAKVTAAYEWKKKNERIQDPNKKETFSAEKVDKLAEEMKENPIFKTYYKSHEPGQKWSKVFLESEAGSSKEWMVNNIIDNPFANAHLAKKKEAVKKLKELGQVIPAPGSASDEYCHFNATLKSLSNKNIDRLSDGELNHILKQVFDENEKYMKGRKSERYFDVSKEHFEETLDVLKIFSDVSDYGAAMAKKLVDRTNHVRTHRWHGMWSQDTVSLDGRNIEATKARIDVLVYGKKPAANNAPKK